MTEDTLTFLGTLKPIVAAKRVRLRDGQLDIVGYDDAKHFTVEERPVADIYDLERLLHKVEREPRFMMIRGKALPGVDRNKALRRKVNGRADGGACFEAAAHHVIPLDFDNVECPEGENPLDYKVAVRAAVARLPSEFFDVTCWWQFTSSAGIKPGIRLRLFFWGSRPTTDQELKDWLPADVVVVSWTIDREARKRRKRAQSEEVAAIASEVTLFHTADGIAFVDLALKGHRETYPVRSKAFKQWLSLEFYRQHGKPPASDAIEQSLVLTEGRARYEAPQRDVHVRVARVEDKIYLDLADEAWRAVEVDAVGWRVVAEPPVRFRRPGGMLPLPEPLRGGSIDALRPFLNVDDDGFLLVVAWQLAALSGLGPYPLLAIYGGHGAAKTSTGRCCRQVIDPHTLPSRAPPRNDHDLYVAAYNSQCIHFENISKLPDWLSDTFCRLATGGGFSTRQLYENTDEVHFSGMRPVILDGIESFIERADLADRAIKLTLDEVPEERRRSENELRREFVERHPAMVIPTEVARDSGMISPGIPI